jgi:hypothetical protein
MSIPNNLNYGVNKSYGAKGAKADYLRYASDSQIYRDGGEIRIEIPTGSRNTHLIPHLTTLQGKIKLKNITGVTGNVALLDQCIYSIFSTMNIFHGSQPLENVLDCARLWTCLYDIQKNPYERNPDSITHLTDVDFYFRGKVLATLTGTTLAETTEDFYFSIVLPSSIFGFLSTKSLPIGQCGSSSFYINLGLNPAAIALTGNVTSVGSYEISEIYLHAKVVTLPDEIESSIMRSINNQIMLPAYAYKTEMAVLQAGQSVFNNKFSFYVSSMKNFLFWFTNSDTANATTAGITKRSITSRQGCNIKSYQLMINGSPYPTNLIENVPNMYNHLLRSFEMLTDSNGGGVLDSACYCVKDGTTTNDTYAYSVANGTTGNYRFIAGIDTDVFNASSDVLLSGISTYGTSLNLNLNLSVAIPTGQNQNLYTAIMFDVLYILTDGILKPNI